MQKQVSGKDPNLYRVQVNGYAVFSAARYVAGNYDTRAVDLYFNEVSSTDPDGKLIRQFVTPDAKGTGTEDNSRPYAPDVEHKTFVMLLSTNAKAVTDTIGQFAENQVAADALTNLLQRDEVRNIGDQSAKVDPQLSRRGAVGEELGVLMAADAGAGTADALTAKYLRVLNAIAAAQGNTRSFDSFAAARAWFEAQSN